MKCHEAGILHQKFAKLAAEYFEAADDLTLFEGEQEEFAAASERAERIKERCHNARLVLRRHWSEHGCRAAAAGRE